MDKIILSVCVNLFQIRYWVFGTDIRNASDVDTGRTPNGRITGLQKNTLYNLRVLAYSRGGDGKMSMPPLYFSMGMFDFERHIIPYCSNSL